MNILTNSLRMRGFLLPGLLLILALAGCQNRKANVTPEAVIEVTDVFVKAPEFIDRLVEVDGMVVHVCRESGKRLFLGDEHFKVLASNRIGKFDVNLEGSDIKATGYIREEKIDENYLDEWEQELSTGAEVQLKEAVHTHEAEAAGQDENAISTQLSQIRGYREQIAAGTQGYISFYSLEVIKIEEK